MFCACIDINILFTEQSSTSAIVEEICLNIQNVAEKITKSDNEELAPKQDKHDSGNIFMKNEFSNHMKSNYYFLTKNVKISKLKLYNYFL